MGKISQRMQETDEQLRNPDYYGGLSQSVIEEAAEDTEQETPESEQSVFSRLAGGFQNFLANSVSIESGANVMNAENLGSTIGEEAGNIADAAAPIMERIGNAQIAQSQIDAGLYMNRDMSEAEEGVRNYTEAMGDIGENAGSDAANLAASVFKAPARAIMSTGDGDYIADSEIGLNYFMTEQEKLEKARAIQEAVGIPADAIVNDTTAFKQAIDVYNYKKKVDQLGGSIEDVWKEFPELQDIANMDSTSASLALNYMDSIRKTHGIVDTFTHMLERGNKELEYNNLQYKIMHGEADDNDIQRAQDLKDSLDKDKKTAPSFIDDPAAAIAGAVAQSAPEMAQSMITAVDDAAIMASAAMVVGAAAGSVAPGVGTVAGGAAGAAGGAAVGFAGSLLRTLVGDAAASAGRQFISRAAGAAFRYGMYEGMASPEIGSRYAEYKEMKDDKGNPLLTDNQAKAYATLGGSLNAGIEMADFGLVTKALGKTPHAKTVFGDIIENFGAKLTMRERFLNGIKDRAADIAKVTVAESAEEGVQSVSDDVVHNMIEYSTGDTSNTVYSAKDIAGRALVSFAESLPGSLGFGLMGGVGGTLTRGVRVTASMRNRAKFEAKYGENARKTMTGTIMVEQLQQAISENNMREKAPDVQRQVLRSELRGTGYEMSYVDTEMALTKENGMDDLKKVAKAAGISSEDLQTAVESKGTIAVPTEQYAQSGASPDLLSSVSYSQEADSIARMQKDAKDTMKAVEEAQQAAIDRRLKLIDTVLDQYFPEDKDNPDSKRSQLRTVALTAIYTNPENPAQGWSKLSADTRAELNEILEPALKALQEGMGKGGQILTVKDEVGNDTYIRTTENDEWYRNFYKTFGRAPTKAELEEMAIAMVTGDPSAPKVAGWIPSTPEEQQAMAAVKPDIDRLRQTLEALEEIKPTMRKMNAVEMEVTEGMSPEAFRVYRLVEEQLENMPVTTEKSAEASARVKRAARVGAILFARHAEIYARAITKKTGKKYTALDYYRERFGLDLNGEYKNAGGMKQETNNQTDKVFNTPTMPDGISIEEERRKFNNTQPIEAKENVIRAENGVAAKKLAVRTWDKMHTKDDEVPTVIGKVIINRRSIRNSVSHGVGQKKLDAVMTLDAGMRKAAYMGMLPDFDGKETKDHYFLYKIMYKGEENYVFCRVKENFGEKHVYIHEVVSAKEIQQKSNALQSQPADQSHLQLRGVALYNYIITNFVHKVDKADNGISETLNQLAGERGAAGFEGLQDRLVTAKQMVTEGKTKQEIWDETGWTQGRDGKWRFEIPDNLDEINFGKAEGETKLWRVYRNEMLYRAYPSLKDLTVKFVNNEKRFSGAVVIENGKPTLQISADAIRESGADEVKKTLVHEVQHMIQFFEGFAVGSNPEAAGIMVKELPNGPLKELYDKFGSYAVYLNIGGEQEARETSIRAEHWTKRSRMSQKVAEERKKADRLLQDEELPPEKKKLLEEYKTLYERGENRTEEEFDRSDELEEIFGNFKEGSKEAETWDALWNYWTDKEILEFEGDESSVPTVHGRDAIITFDGETMQSVPQPEGLAAKSSQLFQSAADNTAFSAWFGNSQIVNKDGTPRVAYHGTATSGIRTFDKKKAQDKVGRQMGMGWGKGKFYFSFYQGAANAAASGAQYRGQGKNPQTMAVYLRIEKPMTEEEYANRFREISGGHELSPAGYTSEYTMRDRDKFITKLDKQLKKEGYDGIVDKDTGSVAVFDSKQVKSVDNQGTFDTSNPDIFMQAERNAGPKGMTTVMSNGRRIISLFESADESTFTHEMAHMFLMDLKDLAKIDEVSAKELEAVDNWASWKKGDAKLYKGTPWAREFAKREQAIVDAEAYGDMDEADRLKREWRQERFARGFEQYLRDGQAPAKGLRAVFRMFRRFLLSIYRAITADGARVSLPVRRVMDRMIATEDEIREMSLDDRYKDIAKAGGEQLLSETETETYQRWKTEAEEEAKEKLQKIVMRDLKKEAQDEYDRRVKEERERKRKELLNEPVYLAERAVAASGDPQLALGWFPSLEAFGEELNKVPTLDEALDRHMERYEKTLDEEVIQSHLTESNVARAMESTGYHAKLEALKATAFAKKMQLMSNITAKTRRAMQSVEESITALPEDIDLKVEQKSSRVKELMKEINRLRFSERWKSSDIDRIETMLRAANKEELQKGLQEFKAKLREDKANEKAVMEANEGKMKFYRDLAKRSIKGKPIHEACDYNGYLRKSKNAARRVQQMIRAKRWEMALLAQQQQAMYAAMANEAKKMDDHVQKGLREVRRNLTARSVKLPKDERYWHRYLAHLLRITDRPPVKPTSGLDYKSLDDLFNALEEGLDATADFRPTELLAMAHEQGENFRGYQSLTMDQFDDAINALRTIYTTGKNKFKMVTVAGKEITGLVDEIINDETSEAQNIGVHNRAVNADTGGLGYNEWVAKLPSGEAAARRGVKWLAMITKPEEILRALGEKAHKYIYGIYEKAAEKEGKMVQEEMDSLREILKPFSHKEKRNWRKRNIEFVDPAEGMMTKENVICMALNLGNPVNRQRLVGGFNVSETAIVDWIQKNMTAKDWQLVQDIWDHLDSYWEQTAAVEEKLNGMAIRKVEAVPFTVTTPDGKTIEMRGGYYPIAYNPEKSSKAAEQAANKQTLSNLTGAQVLGTNRGFTKSRAETDVEGRPLRLEFAVIPEHLQAVIHNINYRLAARDVYRVVQNKAFEGFVSRTLGREYYKELKTWSTDVWGVVNADNNTATKEISRIMDDLRRNSTMAIMGYRVWPVVENVSNIAPVMDRLGPVKTMTAITNFYANWGASRELLSKSVFMENRINSMDRDIRQQPGLFETSARPIELIRDHAYDLMLISDLMLSAPLWVQSYKDAFGKKLAEVKRENAEHQAAVETAQQRASELQAQLYDETQRARERADAEARDAGSSPFDVGNGEVQEDLQTYSPKLRELREELAKAEGELNNAMELPIYTDEEAIKEAESRAVFEADAAVRDVFGSGELKDQASIQRNKNSLIRILTTFYSFFNTQFNAILARYRHAKFSNDKSFIRRWAPFARTIMYRVVLMVFIGSALKFALGLDGSGEDDKWKKVKNAEGKDEKVAVPWQDRFLNVFMKNTLSQVAGGVPIVRDCANVAINNIFSNSLTRSDINLLSVGVAGGQEAYRAIMLASKMSEHNMQIDEQQAKREAAWQERLKKLRGKKRIDAIRKHEEDEKYRHPQKHITYAEVARHGAKAVSSLTAARFGITNTMVDAVTGTMMYLNDKDNVYDHDWTSYVWSAVFDKAPKEREIQPKPPAPAKPKKGKKK